MARITRRRLLKLSASSAVIAQTGGLAAVLATGRAPAFAQGTTVHWLRWADFVPASDALLKAQITQECQKATGITLKVETINANDLQARISSAIQSGTGPDIIMALGNWPQLYAESLADVGDVAEEIGSAQGGHYEVGDGLLQEPKTGQGLPALGPLETSVRRMVHLTARLLQRCHQGLGEGQGAGRRSGVAAVSRHTTVRAAGGLCRTA